MASKIRKKNRWLRRNPAHLSAGFTLIELLVVLLITGFVVTGAFTVILDLMQADRRSSARTETQREMQLAMNYISSELQQGLYVYDGAALKNLVDEGLPVAANSVPVLAFWKTTRQPPTTSDLSGYYFSLVVYYLSDKAIAGGTNNIWSGPLQITRRELETKSGSGVPVPNVSELSTWLPTGITAAQMPEVVVVDYVDNSSSPFEVCPTTWPNAATARTPSDDTLTASGLGSVSSFYACVQLDAAGTRSLSSVIHVRGNALGRANVETGNPATQLSYRPSLKTEVFSRGVIKSLN